MGYWEIVMIAIALSMDACSVGMTDGMQQPNMSRKKTILIAAMFGLFQAAMPLIGYWAGSAFRTFVLRIAPWLSFALLTFLGGKMILDLILEKRREAKESAPSTDNTPATLGLHTVILQAVATSLDALAIGITLLAASVSGTLVCSVWVCAAIIGCITFVLAAPAIRIGAKIGNRFETGAIIVGALILIAIGIKIVVESYIGG